MKRHANLFRNCNKNRKNSKDNERNEFVKFLIEKNLKHARGFEANLPAKKFPKKRKCSCINSEFYNESVQIKYRHYKIAYNN